MMITYSLVIDAGGAEALVNLLADESALSRLSTAECIIAMSQSGMNSNTELIVYCMCRLYSI